MASSRDIAINMVLGEQHDFVIRGMHDLLSGVTVGLLDGPFAVRPASPATGQHCRSSVDRRDAYCMFTTRERLILFLAPPRRMRLDVGSHRGDHPTIAP